MERKYSILNMKSLVKSEVFWPRLYIGLIVLISAEVFSGSSVAVGLWNPMTWLLTYPLYFAHFFFFSTLAIKTGRTSLGALWLWGVLFGLYESWITKVIWYGYGNDGDLIFGNIGPWGYSEISMVVFFHPLVSFIIPLVIACILCPALRPHFPDLSWFTSPNRGGRTFRVWVLLSFAGVLGMNSGGPLILAFNWVLALLILHFLHKKAYPIIHQSDGASIVSLNRRGFIGLCVYLMLLYVIAYFFMVPEGLPAMEIQLLTFIIYGAAISGLYMFRRRDIRTATDTFGPEFGKAEVFKLFRLMVISSLVLSVIFAVIPPAAIPVALTLILWPLIGFELTIIAFLVGAREYFKTLRSHRKDGLV